MGAMINAAVTLPEPLSRGFIWIIFFAFNALLMATGSRMMPKHKSPTREYVRASLASLHGRVASSPSAGGAPRKAMVLHEPQYFCPWISTRQSPQNDSAQPEQRSTAATSG